MSGILWIATSLFSTPLAELAMAGCIKAFKEDWDVTSKHFCLTWTTLWLLMDINFLLFDAATSVVPMPVMPPIVFTSIILSVTSTLTPLELNPDIYRWSYALPANEAYTVLDDTCAHGGTLPSISGGENKRYNIKVQWSERAEEGSKRVPMVPLRASDRMSAAWEEEAVRTPSEESLPQCLEQLPTLEEMGTRQRAAVNAW